MRAHNLVNQLGYDFFVTLDGRISPRMEVVEKSRFVRGNKLFIQIWFDPESADKFRMQEMASLVVIDKKSSQLYLVEGEIEKFERLNDEEQGAIQERFYQSQSLWGITIRIQVAKPI